MSMGRNDCPQTQMSALVYMVLQKYKFSQCFYICTLEINSSFFVFSFKDDVAIEFGMFLTVVSSQPFKLLILQTNRSFSNCDSCQCFLLCSQLRRSKVQLSFCMMKAFPYLNAGKECYYWSYF